MKKNLLSQPKFLVAMVAIAAIHLLIAGVLYSGYKSQRPHPQSLLPDDAPANTEAFVLQDDGTAPAPTPSQARRHVVKSGENFSVIARQYGLTVNQLLVANGYHPDQILQAGAKLKIPED